MDEKQNFLDKSEFGPLEIIAYFDYLDNLRESGETNMFGAAAYLEREFSELDRSEARKVIVAWQHTFSDDSSEDLAYKALGDEDA